MFRLEAARYQPVSLDRPLQRPAAGEVADALADVLAQQLDRACGDVDLARTAVVSTTLDLPISSGWMSFDAVGKAATLRANRALDLFVNAYECASWGYVLRYLAPQLAPGQAIALSILDTNPLGLTYWRGDPNWGHSGFGLTTAVLRRTEGDPLVSVGVATGSNAVAEYCLWLRQGMMGRGDMTLSPPFFPAAMYRPFAQALCRETTLPNRHEQWGHCFGSDPWIGLIQLPPAPERPCRLSSLALNGYWCAADVTVAEGARLVMEEERIAL